jgi:ubiquinone/menaquinone biosynthesis C-methylase UbiE
MDRKLNEKKHGAMIAEQAETIWGWGTKAGQQRARRRAQLLIEHGRIAPNRAVLEIGCGTGLFSRHLARTGARVVVSDLSWDLISQIEARGNDTLVPVLSDAEYLPFGSNAFDAVVGSSILHHLRPVVALDEVFRVLRPEGYIAFAEPNMLNPQIAIQKNIPVIKRWLGDSPDETAFFRWQAKKLLENAGFDRIAVTPYDFLHPLTPPRLIPLISALGRALEKLPFVREIAGSLIIVGHKPN